MKTRSRQLPNEATARVIALIQRIKVERNLKQVELAQALHMTQPALSNLLAGRSGASLTTAQYAAEFAKVPLAELLGGVDSVAKMRPRAYQLSDAANARVITLVRKLRDEKQLTQMQLAELLNVPQPVISNMLASKGRASYAVANRVADAAGVPIFELVGDEKAPRTPDALLAADAMKGRVKQPSGDAFVSYGATRPIDAVRSMGDAEGYDRAWVSQWVPLGGLDVPYTADELWRLMKADYAKLGARQPRDAYDANEAMVMIGKLKELLEQFQPPAPSSTPPAASEHVAAPAKRTRRKG